MSELPWKQRYVVHEICEPENPLFTLGRRKSLQAKALGFLEKACTLINATQRIFSKFAFAYDDVGKVYKDYFMATWKLIRNSSSFEEYLSTLEDEQDHEETALFQNI
jgi:hypothetical protein